MIRFACPGCSATYTVGDEKGGKTGKCPKCQSSFTIPKPDPTASVPASTASAPSLPPLPPSPSNEPVEIAPCPGCQARLSVSASDLGSDVECPYCKAVYKASKAGSAPAPSSRGGAAPGRRKNEDDDMDVVPKGRAVRDDDEEERPSRRRRRDEEEEEEERPSRRRNRDDEDEAPRKRRRRSSGSYEPHRGALVLVLGILGLVGCGIFTAIPAWIMGSGDLKKMDAGEMDPEGRQLTLIGKILGMVSVILTCLGVAFYCVIFLIIGIGGAAAGGR